MASLSSLTSSGPVLVASANLHFRERILGRLPASSGPHEYAAGGAAALVKIEEGDCRVVILDRQLPDLNAEELRARIHAKYPGIQVVIAEETDNSIIAENESFAGEQGSTVLCALSESELISDLGLCLDQKAAVPEPIQPLPGVIGRSAEIVKMARQVRLVAPRNSAVLIRGATGTGKEVREHVLPLLGG